MTPPLVARDLADRVDADERFERWGPVTSGIVVWRPRGANLASLRQHLRDAWVSVTTIGDEVWFRCVAANPDADPDHVFNQVITALESNSGRT